MRILKRQHDGGEERSQPRAYQRDHPCGRSAFRPEEDSQADPQDEEQPAKDYETTGSTATGSLYAIQ
ncbi:hypothetical protein GCM10017600_22510 [Streptosporangium carneum]|uniref:Uncharacterized protein n=1 Tax=Streptosporangium carneum TaxID=47481 RepID=A0A9W6MC63_9ACTN|nr:hypothetical protein GCM10017600_22510 [Streptosporangium carneum]